jgi:hypothetical protein
MYMSNYGSMYGYRRKSLSLLADAVSALLRIYRKQVTLKTVEVNVEYCDHIFSVIGQIFMFICEKLRMYGY